MGVITNYPTITEISDTDQIFINQGNGLKQITKENLLSGLVTDIEELTKNLSDLQTQYTELNSNTIKFISKQYSDLNNIEEGGCIIVTQAMSSGTPTNYPTELGGNTVMILQKGWSPFMAQLAFGHGSDKIAIRQKNGSNTWTSWKYFTPS